MNDDAANTNARIRQAAIELFAERGFAGTGIRDLARRVGITTATLYHHVATKDDLLDSIVARVMDALNASASYWLGLEASESIRTAGLVATHVTVHALAPAEAIVVDRQLAAMRPASRGRAIAARDRYERAWRSLIADGVEAGRFRVDDPKLATLALLGATTAVADWYRPGGSVGVDKLARSYVDMSFGLLRATPPSTLPDLGPALDLFDRRWELTP